MLPLGHPFPFIHSQLLCNSRSFSVVHLPSFLLLLPFPFNYVLSSFNGFWRFSPRKNLQTKIICRWISVHFKHWFSCLHFVISSKFFLAEHSPQGYRSERMAPTFCKEFWKIVKMWYLLEWCVFNLRSFHHPVRIFYPIYGLFSEF